MWAGKGYEREQPVTRFVCVHGHFYQPPRENPWLDAIDPQPSAAPFHDWNARVAAECYAPNTAARILDETGRIQQIINNYAHMSFNVGPTLMRWLAQHDPTTYASIVAADKAGQLRFGGHGPAMAQVYGHLIMPLATPRDRRTQVAWGVADFRHHYGRDPEGMWLAEAAVCTDTLEALAEYGIRYTVLAPHQAAAVRSLRGGDWVATSTTPLDTTMPYLVNLPSGRRIALFFYNGSVSQAIAFQGLLNSGEALAAGLLADVPAEGARPQLAHVATDGETYGHHHRHGEMALAYALQHIAQRGLARITVYGEFLALAPPTHEVQIVEQSSWSCAHGIERWRSDCGCHTGGAAGWNQAWRAPLRAALDWVTHQIDTAWERAATRVFHHPWQARDSYIALINDSSDASVARFMATHARTRAYYPALALLELQRQLMQSYTSCAWFFHDVTGIETVQVLRYAARTLQLANQTLGLDLEEGFHEQLEKVVSNTGITAATLYATQVKPATLTLADICAHDALTGIFVESPPAHEIYLHRMQRTARQNWSFARTRVVVGVSEVVAVLTGERAQFVYGVVVMGEQVLAGGVSPEIARYERLRTQVAKAVQTGQHDQVVAVMHAELGRFDYSLRSIFRDEQRTIMNRMLHAVIETVVRQFHAMYAEHASLMKFLQRMAVPLPAELQVAAAMAIQADLQAAFAAPQPDIDTIQQLLNGAQHAGVVLDTPQLGQWATHALQRLVAPWQLAAPSTATIRYVHAFIAVVHPIDVSLWDAQNTYNVVWQRDYDAVARTAAHGDASAQAWVTAFCTLGAILTMAIENRHTTQMMA